MIGTHRNDCNERNNRRDRGMNQKKNWKSQPNDCKQIERKTKTPKKKVMSAQK